MPAYNPFAPQTISHHFLRRRARLVASRWNAEHESSNLRAVVVKAYRGPFRWRVEAKRIRLPIE